MASVVGPWEYLMEKKSFKVPERLEQHLRPKHLRLDLEPLARELAELAMAGSRELWPEISKEKLAADSELRRRFMTLANDGMYAAQEKMVARIRSDAPLDVSEEILFRGIADAMAWQMIDSQLCYARRLYKEQRSPNLKESNFDSVVAAVEHLRSLDPGAMPLISDLTSFVQLGDILVTSPAQPVQMIEVKEGKENARIGEMLRFYRQSGCERFREILTATEPKTTVKQFERMRRQVARMEFYGDLVGNGIAEDPDTGITVSIPEPTVMIDTWDEMLVGLIEEAKEKQSWAYGVEGSVFVGCYMGEPCWRAGHVMFLGAISLAGDPEKDFHVARLNECMKIPLALPVFNRPLPAEAMFDMLFGRLNVCVGINIPKLIHDCEMAGMNARYATRREMASASRVKANPMLVDGKGVYVELDGEGMFVADGIIFRALFHGQRPESVIRGFLQEQKRNSPETE